MARKSLEARVADLEKVVSELKKCLHSKHSKHDNKGVAEYHSKGGKSRAAKLSKKRRQEIARQAAVARWGKPGDTKR